MPTIQLLDKTVAELIAAGEVVERPASIIKELVENALDAGATRIQVEIKNGGVRYIRVTDNGHGIPCDEMPTAFLRHATSKITTAEDLDAIMTLGFRGEALASIAAMCRVEMLSRQPEKDMGGRYHIEGGELILHEAAGGPVGTTIVVRDIFYNTPARMKFLKKDLTEAAAVTQTLERLALIHTSVSFSYIKDGKRVFTTPGDGLLLSTARIILGNECAEGLVPVHYNRDGTRVTGFILAPRASRATRNMQYFYINSRYIRSKLLTGSLEEAYKHKLMGGRFPGCILDLGIRPGAVDVNVHPAKIEVRFSDEKTIYNAVYSACKEALEPAAAIVPADKRINVFALHDFDYSNKQQTLRDTSAEALQLADIPYMAFSNPYKGAGQGSASSSGTKAGLPVSAQGENASFSENIPKTAVLDRPLETETNIPEAETATATAKIPVPQNEPEPLFFKAIGEVFGTYVLVEQGDYFYLIDKHAAHERYRYDQMLHDTAGQDAQSLLEPLPVNLPASDYATAIEYQDVFRKMGIDFDDFGEGTLLIREIPMILANSNIADIVLELTGAITDHHRDLTPDYVAGLFASVACRGSIMAGDHSHQDELDFIADLVMSRGITHCPHGRPTFLRYSKRELERMFGRLI